MQATIPKYNELSRIINQANKNTSGIYDLTGIDLTDPNVEVLYREARGQFKELPLGAFSVSSDGSTLTLVDQAITRKLESIQYIENLRFDSGEYKDPVVDPETLRNNFNELVVNVRELWDLQKQQGMVADDATFSRALPQLDPGETWMKTADGYVGTTVTDIEKEMQAVVHAQAAKVIATIGAITGTGVEAIKLAAANGITASRLASQEDLTLLVQQIIKIAAQAGDIEIENIEQAGAILTGVAAQASQLANQAIIDAQSASTNVSSTISQGHSVTLDIISKAADIEVENIAEVAVDLTRTAIDAEIEINRISVAATSLLVTTKADIKNIVDSIKSSGGRRIGSFNTIGERDALTGMADGDYVIIGTGPYIEYIWDLANLTWLKGGTTGAPVVFDYASTQDVIDGTNDRKLVTPAALKLPLSGKQSEVGLSLHNTKVVSEGGYSSLKADGSRHVVTDDDDLIDKKYLESHVGANAITKADKATIAQIQAGTKDKWVDAAALEGMAEGFNDLEHSGIVDGAVGTHNSGIETVQYLCSLLSLGKTIVGSLKSHPQLAQKMRVTVDHTVEITVLTADELVIRFPGSSGKDKTHVQLMYGDVVHGFHSLQTLMSEIDRATDVDIANGEPDKWVSAEQLRLNSTGSGKASALDVDNAVVDKWVDSQVLAGELTGLDNSFVKLKGGQSIAGTKTFSTNPKVGGTHGTDDAHLATVKVVKDFIAATGGSINPGSDVTWTGTHVFNNDVSLPAAQSSAATAAVNYGYVETLATKLTTHADTKVAKSDKASNTEAADDTSTKLINAKQMADNAWKYGFKSEAYPSGTSGKAGLIWALTAPYGKYTLSTYSDWIVSNEFPPGGSTATLIIEPTRGALWRKLTLLVDGETFVNYNGGASIWGGWHKELTDEHIINNLVVGGTEKVLSAEQGKLLHASKLDSAQVQQAIEANVINNLSTGGFKKALSAEQGKVLQANIVNAVAAAGASDPQVALNKAAIAVLPSLAWNAGTKTLDITL